MESPVKASVPIGAYQVERDIAIDCGVVQLAAALLRRRPSRSVERPLSRPNDLRSGTKSILLKAVGDNRKQSESRLPLARSKSFRRAFHWPPGDAPLSEKQPGGGRAPSRDPPGPCRTCS